MFESAHARYKDAYNMPTKSIIQHALKAHVLHCCAVFSRLFTMFKAQEPIQKCLQSEYNMHNMHLHRIFVRLSNNISMFYYFLEVCCISEGAQAKSNNACKHTYNILKMQMSHVCVCEDLRKHIRILKKCFAMLEVPSPNPKMHTT